MTSPANDTQAAAAERRNLRLEQLLKVSRRLSEAIAADIAALEAGAFGALKTTDLAFHHRHGGASADVAQAQHGAAIRDHRHQVPLGGELIHL